MQPIIYPLFNPMQTQTAIKQGFIYWELQSIESKFKAAKASIRYQLVLKTDEFIVKAQISRFKSELLTEIDKLHQRRFEIDSGELNAINQVKREIQTL